MTTTQAVEAHQPTAEEQLDSVRRDLAGLQKKYEAATIRENTNADKAERYRRAAVETSKTLTGIARHCEAMIQEVTSLTAKATWDQVATKVRTAEMSLDNTLRSIA